jgi:hypothetical protein
VRRRALATALAAALLLALAGPASAAPPAIKHVFIVVLENESADTTFGPNTQAPYLAHTLRAQGAFVPGYFATGHLSLDNYISLVSGQGPNPYTQADAPAYINFLPGTMGPNGQAIGQGSVYPTSVKTVADQLDAAGKTWSGYMEDMGNSATQPKTCRHPAIGSPDSTQQAHKGDQYAARHNPFVYFHTIIDDQARCDAHVVPLNRLPTALSSAGTTPSYSFITPNLCHDGHDSPCVDGQPGGLVSANEFLKRWIPRLLASPAYADNGLVAIIFDEASNSDASSCCGEVQGPNTPNNGGAEAVGAGGGRVGAVLLSRFIKPGTVSQVEYNHYSLLRSTEDYFGLAHLGYAAASGLKPFGSDVFTNPSGVSLPPPKKPTITLSGVPTTCVSQKFHVHVTATAVGLQSVVVKVDDRQVRSTKSASFDVTVSPRHNGKDNERVSAVVTDRFGRTAKATKSFEVCD